MDTKPASDIIAGAVARAASQGTIHPLDTLKVRMQAQGGLKGPLSKIGKLVPPAGAHTCTEIWLLEEPRERQDSVLDRLYG